MNMYRRIEEGDRNIQGITTDCTNKEGTKKQKKRVREWLQPYAMGNKIMINKKL